MRRKEISGIFSRFLLGLSGKLQKISWHSRKLMIGNIENCLNLLFLLKKMQFCGEKSKKKVRILFIFSFSVYFMKNLMKTNENRKKHKFEISMKIHKIRQQLLNRRGKRYRSQEVAHSGKRIIFPNNVTQFSLKIT